MLSAIARIAAIPRQYFGLGRPEEWRFQGALKGMAENPTRAGKCACGKLKDSRRLLAESLGGYYVLYMHLDQSSCIKILVVDDNSFMREAVTGLLNGENGFEVCAQADSGHEAVQLAEQFKPDVIVMDVSMPEMNGIEATTLIRRSRPDAKIIAFSMHDNELMRNRMHAAGAAAYISKDALAGELIQAIRQFI